MSDKIIYDKDGIVITEQELVNNLPAFLPLKKDGKHRTKAELEKVIEFIKQNLIREKRKEAGLSDD